MRQKDIEQIAQVAQGLLDSNAGDLEMIGPGIDVLCGQLASTIAYANGGPVDVEPLRAVCRRLGEQGVGLVRNWSGNLGSAPCTVLI